MQQNSILQEGAYVLYLKSYILSISVEFPSWHMAQTMMLSLRNYTTVLVFYYWVTNNHKCSGLKQ